MPVPPPSLAAPYDTGNNILNTARTRINDAIVSLGGEMLTNTQPFTQQMYNTAWRNLQAFLANMGYSKFRKRVVLSGFPIVGTYDPTSEAFLDWTTFFDGNAFWVPPDVGVLPQDLILPLRIGERQAGSNQRFNPMGEAPDGYMEGRKTPWNGVWDWRDDKIYMPGAVIPFDLEIWYAAYMEDFATIGEPDNPAVGGTWWYDLPVPIMRCLSAFANYVCAEFGVGRGDIDTDTFTQKAQQDARLIFNVEVNQKQRTNVSRRSYAGSQRNYIGY